MHDEASPHVVATLIALLLAAILVGIAARRFKLPYTVSLVVVGVGLHAVGVIPDVRLTRELLMDALLPALLFEAAIHIPSKDLKRYLPSVVTLAVPGVLIAALLTAALLSLEMWTFTDEALPFAQLVLFGAMIAATDPISVVALFKQLGVEKRVAILIEGESLFNDGTAVVLFGIVLEAIRTGEFSTGKAIVTFVLVAAGGLAIGAAVGLLASWATSLFDEHLIEIALTVVTAYGSFLIAEQVHASGVLATVVAGLLVGNIGKKRGMSPHTRVSVLSFWEFAAFFINSLVFLLIGLEVELVLLVARFDVILMAFAAVLAARALTVFTPIPLLKRFKQPIDTRTGVVLWWGGLRGGLSMVLALALPVDMPGRSELLTMTFGVVLLSVVLQGGTMGLLLKKLGMITPRTEAMKFLGMQLARLKAIKAQRAALDSFLNARALEVPALGELRARLEAEEQHVAEQLNARATDEDIEAALREHAAVVNEHLCEVARDAYRAAHDDNLLSAEEATQLITALEEGEPTPELP